MLRRRRGWGTIAVVIAVGLFLSSTLLAASTPGDTAAIRTTQFSALLLPGNGTIPIQHIIIVMQENHVYDTYFGDYCQAIGPYCNVNGTGIPAGTCVPFNPANLSQGCKQPYLAAASAVTAPVDLVHDWAPAHEAYDNGSLDGFYLAEGRQNSTFMYYDGEEIPTYWDLAEEYGLGDNFFASALSYSTPNHWYLVAGASPPQGLNQSLNRQAPGSTRLTTAEQTYLNQANDTRTIADLLENTSVSWKYYDYALGTYNQAINAPSGAGAQGSAFDFWNPFASQASSYNATMKPHFVASSSFFTDAASDNLPNVSWVLPTFNVSDHPSASIDNGETWVGSIVNAVEKSKDWNSSAIFVTWDDYGGYYDNVPPPPLDGNGLSFRAPLLVISPYSREGYISHQFTYFESLLHLVEWRYHLPSLTSRDAEAPLPLDYFDFNATPRPPMYIDGPTHAVYPAPLQGLGAPRAPLTLTAAAGSASVTLNWTMATAGAAVTTYQLTYGPATDPTLSTVREDGSLTSVTISNLAPGTSYQFSLTSLTGNNASRPVTAVAVPLAGSSSIPPDQPATWTALPLGSGPAPQARSGAGFVFDPADNAEVLFGGLSSSGTYLGDTWEYFDGHWTELAEAHPPPGRAYSAMVYDSQDGYVLLFGGVGAHGYLGDTWKFLGGTWTNLTAVVTKAGSVPTPRGYAAIASDPSASSVLLFGGKGTTGALGDSWRYVKGKWTNLGLKANPPARWGAAMTYDGKDGYPVLQGGNSSTGVLLNDTWRYSSATWHNITSLSSASPGPRLGATMVYDGVDQYVLLFGGSRAGTLVPGTWRFVGGGWVLLSPASVPTPRQFASATFDSLHNGVLLGFGAAASGELNNLTEYDLPLAVGLSNSPGFADAPVVETFFPAVTGAMVPYHYYWTFGDGTNSTLVDATHLYTIPGEYHVVLTVTDAVGATTTAAGYIAVNGPLTVAASAARIGANGSVSFSSVVGGGLSPYRYDWSFGDGLPTGSSQADPTYQYLAPGTYLATVEVTDADGATAQATVLVATNGGTLPVGVVANATSGAAPLWVAFSASVPNGSGPYGYLWHFGDGSPNSTASSPTHNFSSPGTYEVSVNVTNSSGAWGTSFLSISVLKPLVVHATARPTGSSSARSLSFAAAATGGAGGYTFHWLFGDGNVSGGESPTHRFSSAGTYTVTITVTDRAGLRTDSVLTVSVGSPPVAVTSGAAPAEVGAPAAPALAPPGAPGPSPGASAPGAGVPTTLACWTVPASRRRSTAEPPTASAPRSSAA